MSSGVQRLAATAVICALAGACGDGGAAPQVGDTAPPVRASEDLPGGATTVPFEPTPSFALPANNLEGEARADFYAGKALSEQPWVIAPSSTDARDGLGPLYNARSCLACHTEGGHGRVDSGEGELTAATLVRLSIPGEDPKLGAVPEPTYGAQLQARSIALSDQLPGTPEPDPSTGGVLPEGKAVVRWSERAHRYADGEELTLRQPEPELEQLGYGALHPDVRLGLRHTPPLHGLGLLARIAEEDVDALADPDDADGDGISGRPNRVWDPVTGAVGPGRFGLKANQPTLRVQVAAALRDDIGITSSVFVEQPCTTTQSACLEATHGAAPGEPEIADDLLQLVLHFTESIGVPERRKPDDPLVLRGRELFHASGCASCHTPRFVTAGDPDAPHLASQEIWPYTDLLLHDMGPDLADGRSDHSASGSEWRTPPLWGVGLARAVREDAGLLHDGRARTVEEAVLWHGGEATRSRDRFASLSAENRHALLAFVRSL